LGFSLSDAEETACDFDTPKMIQATFDAMVVNDALELGVMSRDMVEALKLALKGLRWLIFESWLRINKHALLGAQLCRRANHGLGSGLVIDQEEDLGSSDALPPLVMMISRGCLAIACFFILSFLFVRLSCNFL